MTLRTTNVALLLGVVTISVAGQNAKPVEEYPVYRDHTYPPPTSLEGLMKAALVVVEGTITGARPHDYVRML